MRRTLSIVGAGRVGRALGRRLRERGWFVGAVVTRSEASARSAVRAIGAGQAQAGLTRQALDADTILIATPDSSVARVAALLARLGGRELRGKVVLHTSGALGRAVLAPLQRQGAETGSLHPMQTFSGHGAPHLKGALIVIEGTPAAQRRARQIARNLGGTVFQMDGRNKPAYHAAGAFVAGHALTLAEAATRVLMSLHFSRRDATRALLPLMRQTLDNFERLGPKPAWTGPLARGDYSTIAAHAAALKKFPAEYFEVYAALSRLGVALLAQAGQQSRRSLERALEI